MTQLDKKPTEIKVGFCHLCGVCGPRSFEHVPPEAAFNNNRVLYADILRLINGGSAKPGRRGRYSQRGAGGYTLCKRCNELTGRWYAPAFIEVARQCMPIAHSAKPGVEHSINISMKPFEFLKQVLVMFCSACPPDFAKKHPSLVRYLLNQHSRSYGGNSISVHMGLFDIRNSSASRQSGISGVVNFESKTIKIISEMSFPPFNFVMDLRSGLHPELIDITHFRDFDPDKRADVNLTLRNLAVNTYLPAVYG